MTFSDPELIAALRRQRREKMTPEEREAEDQAIEDEQYREIENIRGRLIKQTSTAASAVDQAIGAVESLMGGSAWDVEFAETTSGTDILHWLHEARRNIQAAQDRTSHLIH